MSATASLARARTLAQDLPRLILAAERLAFIAVPGQHGRRRAGIGDSFWQFRDWQTGEDTRRIDWRRSATGDRLYAKDREWEAEASLALHLADSPTLDYASSPKLPTKRARAELLLLALGVILLRAGERVALAGRTPPLRGPAALRTLALALDHGATAPANPRARTIVFGDFLGNIPAFNHPPGGAVLHLLDPAECDFPFTGRLIFEGFAGEKPLEAASAQAWRETYRARIAARRAEITRAAALGQQTPLFHRTDQPPARALAALYQALLRP